MWPALGLMQPLDVLQPLLDGGVLRPDLAGLEHAGQDDAGDAGAVLGAPAAVVRLLPLR